ncbi:uncharacterized protein K452DRAFT_284426 [Aplosporella prunicola CBS 121167]|uniref:DNA mismatch repair protein HSM3 N-terminal domain-containing protein n=1 Tax=Aplosporella prunicola CBS 121167 TaxID=1176127 RepID=A0A6A6BLW2_9PEZI|nr:uncharacterized protein K452DRAFT_284426 [Aplosporella prunicola CBS 121167]KAF2145036.1 hypothetical protein K452DRAFT_284426 [Aplosporella prunicola CBS 121167]
MSTSRELVTAAVQQLPIHFAEVEQDPSTPLDVDLIDLVQPFVSAPDVVDASTSQALTAQLARLLPTLQQDPTPAIQLLVKLIEPYDFDAIRSIQPPVDFAAGLDLAAVPYHPLALALLEKASLNGRHAEFIASSPSIVSNLVQLWLSTEDIGIADRATNVLYDLLHVDRDPANPTATEGPVGYGVGFMWKRVFGDRDIYSLFFRLCGGDVLNRSRKTVAQARLMAWLPRVGELSWEAITLSQHAEVEQRFGLATPGLLNFAALHVVDYKDDILMHISLIEFYSALLKTCSRPSRSTGQSKSLEYLKATKVHERTLSYFLNPAAHESFETSYLYRPAAHYLATYASTYPDDFEASAEIRAATLRRLVNVFSDTKLAHWVHGHAPQHDLHVLASLPRTSLLPSPTWDASPLALLPAGRSTNPDVLRTLATIFHGPSDGADYAESLTFPPPPQQPPQADDEASAHTSEAEAPARLAAERAAARSLAASFLEHNSAFFADLVTVAETLALKDNALAALDLVAALVMAHWPSTSASASPSPTPSTNTPAPDSASDDAAFPPSGPCLLTRPGNPLLPYLLRPAPTAAHLAGRDSEAAHARIAARKFEVLRLLKRELEREISGGSAAPGARGVVELLRGREAEGAWGRGGDVGGHIAAMEL